MVNSSRFWLSSYDLEDINFVTHFVSSINHRFNRNFQFHDFLFLIDLKRKVKEIDLDDLEQKITEVCKELKEQNDQFFDVLENNQQLKEFLLEKLMSN